MVIFLLLVGPAGGEELVGAQLDEPSLGFWLLPPDERLAFEDIPADPAPDPALSPATTERRPNWLLTSVASALAVAGGGVNAFTDKGHQSYHFAHEGWFGADTKYGGADKASHFVDYYVVSKELAKLYVFLGHTPGTARWLGVGVSTLTGLVNEIGDGTTRWGFSGEDLAMDFAGALTAALVDVSGTEDLLGFRRGTASFDQSSRYSNEIYVADFHLAGAARRLGLNIGPLKYLLLSVTYGTRGYPGDPADPATQRRVGFEVGLDFKQILDDLNIRRNTWWGYGLHVVADNIRVPFTAVGFRYDLNHGRWYGPNSGN